MKPHRFLAGARCGIAIVTVASGCSVLKAKPAPDAGFLAEPERMAEHRERLPFDRGWVDPAYRATDYDSIQVAPVNTEHVLAQNAWARMNIRTLSIDQDIARIAAEFRDRIVAESRASEHNRFAIVDTPGEHAAILEIAITELVPGKAFIGAIGLASWGAPLPIGVPVGTVASFADDGWMAIEGRVRDAGSSRVVAMFADREASKSRIVDLQALTWYGHARESMNDWANQFVLIANAPQDVRVEDSSPFTLLPW